MIKNITRFIPFKFLKKEGKTDVLKDDENFKSLKESKQNSRQEQNIKQNYDPELQKLIQEEEMKIAEKIALEFTKNYKNHSQLKKSPKKYVGEVFKTGIPGFDTLLGSGGIPFSTSTLVEGGPGSGKTIFCLHVAMNFCREGKNVLYMSFEEPEERLIEHMESFGFDVRKYLNNGQLIIKRFNALDIARSVEALLSEAKKELLIDVQPILIPQDTDPDLVIVDSLTSISSAFSGEESRFRIYMEQLFRYLENHQISALLIREVANPTHVGLNMGARTDEATSFLSDGIIVFYNVIFDNGRRTRAMEILKLRGQSFDRRIVEAEIVNGKGLIIYPEKTLKGKYRLT